MRGKEGEVDGVVVGSAEDGAYVEGAAVSADDGEMEGETDGVTLGKDDVGSEDGAAVGIQDGPDGDKVGFKEGADGTADGTEDGV